VGLEAGAAEIGAGGLQRVEQESGGFQLDASGGHQAHDLHEGDLDGVGVLEDGKFERCRTKAGAVVFYPIKVELDALVVVAFVEVAEFVAAQCGASALRANLDVLTPVWKRKHVETLTPPPP